MSFELKSRKSSQLNNESTVRYFRPQKISSTPMKRLSFYAIFVVTFLGLQSGYGTTVIPPTFDELVGRADVIFQGTVTDVQSQWTGEGAQRRIVSYVTFKVEDTMKGSPGDAYTLRMLGGTVDGETMEVTDSPKFKVGDRDILFVENNGSQFVPLVGIMHGRFHIENDQKTGREIMTTNERKPLQDVSRLGKEDEETTAAANTAQALSLSEFKSVIRQTLRTQLISRPGQ